MIKLNLPIDDKWALDKLLFGDQPYFESPDGCTRWANEALKGLNQ